MKQEKIFEMSVGKVYPLLVNKAVRKSRTKDELAKGKSMDKILGK